MKRLWMIAMLWLPVGLNAAGPGDAGQATDAAEPVIAAKPRVRVKSTEPPRAWIGLTVTKPDETITAHLPSLPPGIGFVIRSTDPDGPADAAGLREYDVLWKIGDQMLVNEGQLAALLRLAEPGDEIVLSGFRGGKPLEVKATLGETPASKRGLPDDLVDQSILPGECRPMRVVNVSEKLATFATEEGRAEVRKESDGYNVRIEDAAGKAIYEGAISKNGKLDQIPENWRRRVHALRRGLDHALDGRNPPYRQPRPRVVPPPESRP